MPSPSFEKRLEELESRVDQLQNELRAAQRPAKDWRRTIGAFTDDAGMQEILREAMKLREADRRKTRVKRQSKRKSRQ
jgi:hypothetical protein